MTTGTEKSQRVRKAFSAREKSQAVLSLWSGRRKPSAICRELTINWATLDGWQRRAVNGMVRALGPAEPEAATPGLVLEGRLEQLLALPVKTPETIPTPEIKVE